MLETGRQCHQQYLQQSIMAAPQVIFSPSDTAPAPRHRHGSVKLLHQLISINYHPPAANSQNRARRYSYSRLSSTSCENPILRICECTRRAWAPGASDAAWIPAPLARGRGSREGPKSARYGFAVGETRCLVLSCTYMRKVGLLLGGEIGEVL